MEELKIWLEAQREIPLEGMDEFFTARVKIYDEHMSIWKEAYRVLPDYLPEKVDKFWIWASARDWNSKEYIENSPPCP